MPAWPPISSDSSRRSVMASAIGLASWNPAASAPAAAFAIWLPPTARTPAPCCVQPRGRATKAASTLSPSSRNGFAPSWIFSSDFTGNPFP